MRLVLKVDSWDALRADARVVRDAVFLLEQKIAPELEWDEMDAMSDHCVAYLDGAPVGTGRLLPDAHIGRMAVLAHARKHGVGGEILQRLLEKCRARGFQQAFLNAQTHALSFYQRHGFVAYGDEFFEAGIAHRAMRRTL